jgi:hypothetical protein
MLQPTWNNFSIGAIIRKQKDFRNYSDIFNADSSYVNNFKKLRLLIFNKKVLEENIIDHDFKSNDVLMVKGLKNFFNDLYDANNLIYENLLKITNKKNLQGLNFNYENSITLHVRRSDFNGLTAATEITDDQWFVRIINLLRKKLNQELKVYIFSDVKNHQIQNLLSLTNVYRLDYKTSVADLLSMTKSKIFVGSKHSTFSHWVSYLGQMPTVWPHGCLVNKVHGKLLRENVVETNGFTLDENFIFQCEKSLNF